MNLILKAAKFAETHHRGVPRKWGGGPYIYHPMRVAGRGMLIPGIPEHAVAAYWLHDCVEDPNAAGEYTSIGVIDREFGPQTAYLVAELTNPKKPPGLNRAERKAMDRERLAKSSYWARIGKLLDRIDNLRDMTQAPASFLKVYIPESQLLVDCLENPTDSVNHCLAEELRRLLCDFKVAA